MPMFLEKENTKWCHSYATSELFLLMIQTPAIACMVWYGNMTIWNTNIKNLCPILLPVNFSLYFDSWFYILLYIVIGIMTGCGSNNVVFGNTWSSLFHTERGGIYKPFSFFLIYILHPFFFLGLIFYHVTTWNLVFMNICGSSSFQWFWWLLLPMLQITKFSFC